MQIILFSFDITVQIDTFFVLFYIFDEMKPPTLQLSDNDSFSEVEEISVSPEFILESDAPEISDEEIPATTSVNKQAALLSVIIPLVATGILVIVVILTVIIVRKKRRK